MSDLRIGCLGSMVLSTLYMTAVNHHWIQPQADKFGSLLGVFVIGFIITVSLFGKGRTA